MQRFKESVIQVLDYIEELKSKGDLKVEAVTLKYVFDTDDCNLEVLMPDKKVINLTKIKK